MFDDPDFAPADPAKATLHAIQAELADGERLVRIGRPRQPGPTSWAPMIALIVGIGWGAMGLILLLAGVSDWIDGRDVSQDVGKIVAVCTILGLAGILLVGSWAWSRFGPRDRVTAYALTDRRVILRTPVLFGYVQVRSFRPQDFSRVGRIEDADGSGMILLEGTGPLPNEMQGPVQIAWLRGLEGVREVEALIRTTLLPD